MHSDNKAFHCHLCVCDNNFSDDVYLKRHLVKAHVRMLPAKNAFKCMECDQSFSQISNIIEHLTTHTASKQYQCNHCQKTFSRYTDCHTHMMKHSGEKLHLQCRYCDKTFSQDNEYQIHMETHTIQRSQQCSNCGNYFSINHDSYLHTNTAEKPYVCRKCEKNLSDIQPIMQNQTHYEPHIFKGIKFVNNFRKICATLMQLSMHFLIAKVSLI